MCQNLPISIEQWKDIPNCPTYEASSLGRIRGRRGIRKLTHKVDTHGYPFIRVQLRVGGEVMTCIVSRLIASAFLGEPMGRLVCHHNGNSLDNRIENLYYGTARDNSADARTHGTIAKGERHGRCLLTEMQVVQIRESAESMRKLAKLYAVTLGTIWKIKHKLIWRWL